MPIGIGEEYLERVKKLTPLDIQKLISRQGLPKRAYALARDLQTEVWGRHSPFGTREEWAKVLCDDPDLMELPIKDMADRVLENLPERSAVLSKKRGKSTEETIKEAEEMLEMASKAGVSNAETDALRRTVDLLKRIKNNLQP